MNLFSHLKFYLLFVKCYTDAASYVEVMLKKNQLLFSKLKEKKNPLTCIALGQKASIPVICSEDRRN